MIVIQGNVGEEIRRVVTVFHNRLAELDRDDVRVHVTPAVRDLAEGVLAGDGIWARDAQSEREIDLDLESDDKTLTAGLMLEHAFTNAKTGAEMDAALRVVGPVSDADIRSLADWLVLGTAVDLEVVPE